MWPMENGIWCRQGLKEMLSSTLVVRNPIQMLHTILFSADVLFFMVCFDWIVTQVYKLNKVAINENFLTSGNLFNKTSETTSRDFYIVAISVFNLILPCVLITGIALMGFYMPSDSGEKVRIKITSKFVSKLLTRVYGNKIYLPVIVSVVNSSFFGTDLTILLVFSLALAITIC